MNKKSFLKSKLYTKEIHDLIPGGAHTYSKGDDQFPQNSPSAIFRGKGAYVWDIDGNKFLDCSMGLTSVSIGHAYEPILSVVNKELANGVNFQRPSYIEREMAKTFLKLIPQHDRIKFSKNGSTATTAAVKLARAFTGKKLIAFPHDHPFYSYDDWFIGKTFCNKGVPKEISDLTVTFKSCSILSLEKLFKDYPNQIAAVITEPERSSCSSLNCELTPDKFLLKAIELTKSKGAVFILDEMITGFKIDFPGAISKYNLSPDLATWGKGIANGFSFSALTGKKEIMDLGGILKEGEEKVFLTSTTHGGETHSIRAGIKTIEIFKKKNVIKHNHKIGNLLIKKCSEIINNFGLENFIQLYPCNWMVTFLFKDSKKNICDYLKTLFFQEMINNGVLFQGIFVPCYSHKEVELEFFLNAFKKSLSIYNQALTYGYKKYYIGKPIKPVFRKII